MKNMILATVVCVILTGCNTNTSDSSASSLLSTKDIYLGMEWREFLNLEIQNILKYPNKGQPKGSWTEKDTDSYHFVIYRRWLRDEQNHARAYLLTFREAKESYQESIKRSQEYNRRLGNFRNSPEYPQFKAEYDPTGTNPDGVMWVLEGMYIAAKMEQDMPSKKSSSILTEIKVDE